MTQEIYITLFQERLFCLESCVI